MSEDYCSFELSKLLKEKGFDWDCEHYYKPNGEIVQSFHTKGSHHINSSVLYEHQCLAPTYQMAMRFLRKIKKIFINIRYVPESKDDNIGPCYVVDIYSENNGGWVSNHIVSTSFEGAAEESLTFCLIKLI